MEPDIFKKIENAPRVDFGSILSRSIDMVKLVWQDALVHSLLAFGVALPLLLLILIPVLPIYIDLLEAGAYGNGYDYEPDLPFSSPLPVIVYSVIVIVASFAMQVIILPIAGHFYKVLKKVDTVSSEEIGGYFVLLKGNVGKLFLLALASGGIAIVAALLCYLPIFYVMVPLQLILPIFVFNQKLSVSDTIRAAFKLGHKYWIYVFGIIMLSSMIAQLGLILCFVGVFLTAYFVHLPMYFFYKDTIGFDDELPIERT